MKLIYIGYLSLSLMTFSGQVRAEEPAMADPADRKPAFTDSSIEEAPAFEPSASPAVINEKVTPAKKEMIRMPAAGESNDGPANMRPME